MIVSHALQQSLYPWRPFRLNCINYWSRKTPAMKQSLIGLRSVVFFSSANYWNSYICHLVARIKRITVLQIIFIQFRKVLMSQLWRAANSFVLWWRPSVKVQYQVCINLPVKNLNSLFSFFGLGSFTQIVCNRFWK